MPELTEHRLDLIVRLAGNARGFERIADLWPELVAEIRHLRALVAHARLR